MLEFCDSVLLLLVTCCWSNIFKINDVLVLYNLSSLTLIFQAHEQLRAVLLTLLEELPSDLPILLLGTNTEQPNVPDTQPPPVFAQRSMYVLCFETTANCTFGCIIWLSVNLICKDKSCILLKNLTFLIKHHKIIYCLWHSASGILMMAFFFSIFSK